MEGVEMSKFAEQLKLIDEIKRLLSELEEQIFPEGPARWIDYKEELPNTNRDVRILFSDGSETVGWYSDFKSRWYEYEVRGIYALRVPVHKEVVAWKGDQKQEEYG
jgi:hypothetical protein